MGTVNRRAKASKVDDDLSRAVMIRTDNPNLKPPALVGGVFTVADIKQHIPAFKAYFDWIRNI